MEPLILLLACTVVLVAVFISVWMNRNSVPKSRKPGNTAEIPGPKLIDKVNGHFAEIASAGSLHEYLLAVHRQYGTVVAIWMGKMYVVSVASHTTFKKLVPVFQRPRELFMLFEPLFTSKSITYANYEDGRGRRQWYDKAFSHGTISTYYQVFQQVTDEVVEKWTKAADTDHLPLQRTMLDVAIKAIAISAFGEYFKDPKSVPSLQDNYDIVWTILEDSLTEGFPKPGSSRRQQFEKARETIFGLMKDIIEKRRLDRVNSPDRLFCDYLMDLDDSEERIFADGLTYIVGGFHTTGNMLTWALYYLARDLDIQEKLATEIQSILGEKKVDGSNISQLKYLRQVQEETLRCSVLAPWAAKYMDEDTELDGYMVPAKTPIITSLGIMLYDTEYWPEPSRFDPDRFSAENIRQRPAHVFSPFGLAGKRICPGYRFAYSETAVVLATLVRRFRFKLVDNLQEVKPTYGLVTHVSEEVWISLSKR